VITETGTSTRSRTAKSDAAGERFKRRIATRVPLRLRAPLIVHLGSLAIVLAYLLRLGRSQWFFGDEWDFLVDRGLRGARLGLFQPHNEHWSTTPILIFRALYSGFGLRTYIPYLLVIFLLHLALAHVLWLIMCRGGINPWLSSGVILTFLVGGAGSENLMWAFQIGFVGAVLFGLIALLLVNDPRPSLARDAAAAAVAVFSLTWSAMAIPMVAACGCLAWAKRGWRSALRVVGPPALVYMAWFRLVGHEGMDQSVATTGKLLVVPDYVWRGLVTTVEGYTFLEGAGPVVLLAVTFTVIRRGNWWKTRAAAIPATAIGAVLLYASVASGRVAFGVEQANAGRYHYLAWALLVPTLGLCLHEMVGGHRSRLAAVLVLCLGCSAHGLNLLSETVRAQEDHEQSLRRTVQASADLAVSGAAVFAKSPIDVFGPNLSPPELIRVRTSGILPPVHNLTAEDRLRAEAGLQIQVPPYSTLPVGTPSGLTLVDVTQGSSTPAGPGCVVVRPAGTQPAVSLRAPRPGAAQFTSPAGGVLKIFLRNDQGVTLESGLNVSLVPNVPAAVDLAVNQAAAIFLLPTPGETTLCGLSVGAR